jgi:hypothetical protein
MGTLTTDPADGKPSFAPIFSFPSRQSDHWDDVLANFSLEHPIRKGFCS